MKAIGRICQGCGALPLPEPQLEFHFESTRERFDSWYQKKLQPLLGLYRPTPLISESLNENLRQVDDSKSTDMYQNMVSAVIEDPGRAHRR